MCPIKIIEPGNGKPKRPDLLTLLCILSFIGSGLAALSNLIVTISWDNIGEIVAASGITVPGIEQMLATSRNFFTISSMLYFISLVGVIKMWKLKKTGFHIYTISQILLLILPSFYISELGFPTIPVLVTTMFVLLYASNLKYMS